MIHTRKTAALTLGIIMALAAHVLAQPRQPPPEAYIACENKQAGDKANFTTPRGKDISGICEEQEDGRLLLKPDNFGKKGSRNVQNPQNNSPKPPPEAYTACEGKQQGEKASFTNRQGNSISGNCEEQRDGRLLLRPENLDRRKGPDSPHGMTAHTENHSTGDSDFNENQPPRNQKSNGKPTPPEAAYRACEGKSVGDEVQLTTPQGRTITGTCEQDGDRLYLRPEQPRRQPADTAAVEPPSMNGLEEQQAQQPQEEESGGFMDGVKSFWKDLWQED